jgi:putative copper export protein
VCRVDVAGAAGGAANTRALTAAGFALLVASRWLHLAGYALAFGVCAALLVARPALAGEARAARRLRRLVGAGIALLVLAEPLALLAQTAGRPGGALLDAATALDVLGSGYGLVLAQRLGAALLLWVLLGAASSPGAAPLSAPLGAALALLNGAANPAAGPGNLALGAVLAAADQMALGLLLGGGAALGSLWLSRAGQALRERLRPVALGCLGALAAGALLMAALRPPAPAPVLATPYGLALLARLAALLVAALAAHIALRRGSRPLWRAAAAASGGALALAGLLVSLP